MTVRRLARDLAQHAAYRLGVPAVAGTVAYDLAGARGCLEIFFGHHVLPDAAAGCELRAGELHSLLRYLRRTRDLVTLAEGLDWLRRPRRGDRLAALTFDDGYENNLSNLLPVLQATGTPATVFVSTRPIVEGGRLWFEQVRTALQRSRVRHLGLSWLPAPLQLPQSDPAAFAEQVMELLQQSPPELRDRRVAELLERLPPEASDRAVLQRPLTVEQLQCLAADPLISIGAHTHSHAVLSCCAPETAEEELQTNLHLLERLTGERPRHFAYPRGRADDFRPEHCDLLARSGIEAAVTTVPGSNQMGADALALRRIPLGSGGVERFAWTLDCRRTSCPPLPRLSGGVQRPAALLERHPEPTASLKLP